MQVTINAIGKDIAIPDPFPTEGSLTIGAAMGTSKTFHVSPGQLDRIVPQLRALELLTLGDAAGTPLLTWDIGVGTRDDSRQIDALAALAPKITTLAAASIAHGGVAGVIVKGIGFMKNCVKAAKQIGGGAGVTYTAVLAGAKGNSITVKYVVAGNSTALSVSVTGTDITVNLATNSSGVATSTVSQVQAAVAGSAPAALLVVASGSGSGVQVAQAKQYLGGGQGPTIGVTVGLDACTVTAMTDTQLTVTVPALTEGAATNISVLRATLGLVASSVSVPLT